MTKLHHLRYILWLPSLVFFVTKRLSTTDVIYPYLTSFPFHGTISNGLLFAAMAFGIIFFPITIFRAISFKGIKGKKDIHFFLSSLINGLIIIVVIFAINSYNKIYNNTYKEDILGTYIIKEEKRDANRNIIYQKDGTKTFNSSGFINYIYSIHRNGIASHHKIKVKWEIKDDVLTKTVLESDDPNHLPNTESREQVMSIDKDKMVLRISGSKTKDEYYRQKP